MKIIDLRSDTVTKPSQEMLLCMVQAPVGDDVIGEDPTVNELESYVAKLCGKEAAIYAATGTQSNLMSVMSHCGRGDEYIVGQQGHTYKWEGGGAAVLGGVQPQPLDFESDGSLCLKKVKANIKPIDIHFARTKLLCLENTHFGKVLPLSYLSEVEKFCKENKLASHLDGARIFNAAVKLGVDVRQITQHFDTVSLCLSKGLGAPIGSVLCGPKKLIDEARHWRKMLGGGMRQAGIIAAAGLYALKNNVQRLAVDHDNARLLAQGLSEINEITVEIDDLQTNILFISIAQDSHNALQLYLKDQGIMMREGNRVRLVTHLDVDADDMARVVMMCKKFFVEHPQMQSTAENKGGQSLY